MYAKNYIIYKLLYNIFSVNSNVTLEQDSGQSHLTISVVFR